MRKKRSVTMRKRRSTFVLSAVVLWTFCVILMYLVAEAMGRSLMVLAYSVYGCTLYFILLLCVTGTSLLLLRIFTLSENIRETYKREILPKHWKCTSPFYFMWSVMVSLVVFLAGFAVSSGETSLKIEYSLLFYSAASLLGVTTLIVQLFFAFRKAERLAAKKAESAVAAGEKEPEDEIVEGEEENQ